MRHLAVAIVFAISPSAFAELVTNGDFESPSSIGSLATYTAVDSSSLFISGNGWTVSTGDIDHIGTYWVGADGGESIDMDGNNPGQIQQTLVTVIGQEYVLSFFLAVNSDVATSGTRSVQVDAGVDLTSGTLTLTKTSTSSTSNMEWANYGFRFTASTTSTILSFTSLDAAGTGSGIALDDVSVFEAPEPASFLLFGAGLGGLGLWRRTQKKKAIAKKA